MKKIIFVNRFFYPDLSATSQLLSDLAFYLAEKGESVEVICARQSYDENGKIQKKRENIKGVHVTRIYTTNFGRLWLPGRVIDYSTYFFGMLFHLLILVKRGDTVVVKTDPPLSSILTWPIITLKGGRQINWVQDLFPEVAIALKIKIVLGVIGRLFIWMRNASFRYSHLTVVIGEVMKAKLINNGVPENKIKILTNWSDKKIIYAVSPSENPLRKKWGLEGKFVVGYSGNMGRVHDFLDIISAIKILQPQKNIVFVFIGNGPQKNMIEAAIGSLDNVHFFPYQDYHTLRYSLSVPDIHLISLKPSIEGYCVPSKFYGVLAVSRPVVFIGDPQGELAMQIQKDNSGVVIQRDDADGLVDAILSLSQNPKDLRLKGNNALRSFMAHYDKNDVLHDWHQLIDQD